MKVENLIEVVANGLTQSYIIEEICKCLCEGQKIDIAQGNAAANAIMSKIITDHAFNDLESMEDRIDALIQILSILKANVARTKYEEG